MDYEALKTSAHYAELREAHFNGGYLSQEVTNQVERFKQLSDHEKFVFFRDAYNTTYETAKALQAHPMSNNGRLNLTDKGLGIIDISAGTLDLEDGSFLSLEVTTSFDPTPNRQERWIGSSRETVQLEQEPQHWSDPTIYATADGDYDDADEFFNIDEVTARLLDIRETLETASTHLDT